MQVDESAVPLDVTIFSFGFKYGLPEEANILWDVRFLPNPYWEEPLRHLTGKDREIREYVLESRAGKSFMELLMPLLSFTLSESRDEGKQVLKIGIGCTGGHHRSVSVVERLAKRLAVDGVHLRIEHRDIGRE